MESKLVKTAEAQPTWVITSTAAIERAASHATDLRERGVVIPRAGGRKAFAARDARRVGSAGASPRLLVEAGPELSSAFLGAQLVDTFYWYRAPKLLGEHGTAAFLHATHSLARRASPRITVSAATASISSK
ncbi:MAG: dihydrofolate reductase family protein [Alphaproteobacteria bacterium]